MSFPPDQARQVKTSRTDCPVSDDTGLGLVACQNLYFYRKVETFQSNLLTFGCEIRGILCLQTVFGCIIDLLYHLSFFLLVK